MFDRRKGFSLVVVAMAITVVGLLLTATLPTEIDRETAEMKESADNLKQITDALESYRETHGILPMPSGITLSIGEAGYGVGSAIIDEYGCDSSSKVCNDGMGTRVGGLPTRALRLPDSAAFDEWGNRYTYAVNTTGHSIKVKNLSGVGLPGVQAVVISHGKTGMGAASRSGTLIACSRGNLSETASDYANCGYRSKASGEFTFVKDSKNVSASKQFDDMVAVVHGCPANVGGCNLWLDAKEDFSINDLIRSNGVSVDVWKDKSGNVSDARKPLSSSQEKPLWNSSGLVFDASKKQHLVVNAPNIGSIFIVAGADANNSNNTLLGSSDIGSFYLKGSPEGEWDTGVLQNITNQGEFSNLVKNLISPAPEAEPVPDSAPLQLYSAIIKDDAIPAKQLVIGGHGTGSSASYWSGKIAEIITYPHSLDSFHHKQVECYLADKWGICPNLAGGGAAYCSDIKVSYCGATP